MTTDTSGQRSTTSCEFSDLPIFSASRSPARKSSDRLQAALNAILERRQYGSMEFVTILSPHTTPSGRQLFRLAASERRTAGNGCSGWPTCSARDWKDTPGMAETGTNPDGTERTRLDMLTRVAALASWPTPRTPTGGPETAERKQELGRTESGGGDLAAVATLAAWPTPQANKNTKNNRDPQRMKEGGAQTCLADAAHLAGWATQRAEDAESAGMRHSRGVADTLTAQAGQGMPLASWATPIAQDAKHSGLAPSGPGLADKLSYQVHGIISTSSPAGTGKRGVLNPNLSRWLMGLPLSWTLCGMLAYLKIRSNRRLAPSRSSATASEG